MLILIVHIWIALCERLLVFFISCHNVHLTKIKHKFSSICDPDNTYVRLQALVSSQTYGRKFYGLILYLYYATFLRIALLIIGTYIPTLIRIIELP